MSFESCHFLNKASKVSRAWGSPCTKGYRAGCAEGAPGVPPRERRRRDRKKCREGSEVSSRTLHFGSLPNWISHFFRVWQSSEDVFCTSRKSALFEKCPFPMCASRKGALFEKRSFSMCASRKRALFGKCTFLTLVAMSPSGIVQFWSS